MPDSSSERDPLDRLAEEFVARFRTGERPSIEDYARRHPELAADIRDLFPALVEMEQLKPVTGDYTLSGPNAQPEFPADRPSDPTRVGEFRILRRVGVGGMGVVYEAVQESLGRHVALKLLPPDALLDARRLERFRREARAAAGLHHTNIVPVFGTGEADGRHFYAMQFISGHPLDAVVDEVRRLKWKSPEAPREPSRAASEVAAALVTGTFTGRPPLDSAAAQLPPTRADGFTPPSVTEPIPAVPPPPPSGLSGSASESGSGYWVTCARLGAQVADALAYAHGQGVLHRDIKPANLLLDLRGIVWITDFGLAKATDADNLTQSGDIVGTLRYMAPERFDGAGDARADVYALGLTLYELLTLKPAFDASNRAKLVEQALAANPPKPRSHNPAIPRDLETIVLKCIARDPALRYPTAAELAADLRRYIEDRPILARRAGNTERALRWCRRNPAVAALLTAVGSLLTVVAAGGVVFNVRLGHALTQSKSAQKQSEEDRTAALAARDAAVKARQAEREKVFESLVAEAKASRFSRRIGQRFGTLAAIREAVALARELNKPAATFDELRNIAVAALALPDLRPDEAWVTERVDEDRGWWLADVDPTYTFAAVVNIQGAVSVRRVGTGPDDCGEIARLPSLGGNWWVRWGPGGHLAHTSGTAGRLQVWRMEGEKPVRALDVPAERMSFGFTPDGRRVMAAAAGQLRVYDLANGRAERAVAVPAATGLLVHHPFRPEVAMRVGSEVVVQNLKDGRRVHLKPAVNPEWVVWHPHGELLAVTAGTHVEIWDVSRQQVTYRLDHPGGGVIAAFNETGDVLTSHGWAGRVRHWNPYTGREIMTTLGGSNGGNQNFGRMDRLARAYPGTDPATAYPLTVMEVGREYRSMAVGNGAVRPNRYWNCSAHPGGRLLAVATASGVSLMDLATGAEQGLIPENCQCVLFEPDGNLLMKKMRGPLFRLPVWIDPNDPQRVRVGPPQPLPVPAQADTTVRSADGTVLAAADFTGATVWPAARPHAAVRLGPLTDCRHVAVSPDGKRVATGSWHGRGIKVWEADTGALVREFLPNVSGTWPFFSPDGRWLFNQAGESWRTSDWSEGPRHPGSGKLQPAFAPDGRVSAWGGKGFVTLTEPDTGRELVRLEDPNQDAFDHMTFSPDGELLIGVTIDGLCVRVWNLRKVRRGLAELGLDWDAPPYPAEPAADRPPRPLTVEVVGAELLSDPRALARHRLELLARHLATNPNDGEALADRGDCYSALGQPAAAVEAYDKAVAAGCDGPLVRRQRATAAFRLRRWSVVIADADAVLAKEPDDAPTRYLRAQAYRLSGRHAEAIADYTEYLKQVPKSGNAHAHRADCFDALGKPREAAADRVRAAALAPDDPVVLNNLAWHLVVRPGTPQDAERGLRLVRRAAELAPEATAHLNTLGVALYRAGHHADAAAALGKSLASSSGASAAFDLYPLALCHSRLGDEKKAREFFAQAVTWHESKAANLGLAHAAELTALRAEAGALLGLLAPPPRPAAPR